MAPAAAWALAALCLGSACSRRTLQPVAGRASDADGHGAYVWRLPPGFPKPKVPDDNPMTYEKVRLGRRLFYDRRLSQNGTQSCGSCHKQNLAFTDGLARAVGSTGERNRRGAQSLANVAYLTSYTWANPLLQTLEAQAMIPIFGRQPVELGASDIAAFVAPFAHDPRYAPLFAAAYPGDAEAVSLKHIVQALACFERTIISGSAPYDAYFFRGKKDAISALAKDGATLFFSERLECNHCHSGFNLMDATQHAATRQPNMQYHNTGLYNVDGKGAYPAVDTGVREVTHLQADMGRFRAQSLRNIMVTGPYFHDGSAPSIDDVLAHYMAAGRTLTGADAGDGAASPLKSQFMIGFTLSPVERAQLHAFFESLTDTDLLTRPDLSDPWVQEKVPP
jgi:cytochrome c peroxidase